MKFVAALGVACLLLSSMTADASLIRKKSNRKSDFYDRTQVSTTKYSRPTMKKKPVDPQANVVRSPERIKVERAPKPKQRRHSHFTEGP